MFYRSWLRTYPTKITEYYGDNHWETFERVRKKHNDNICSETNKLVLRLDMLINPTDQEQKIPAGSSGSAKKIDLDKSVVEWTLDDLVKLCPYCAKSFTFARRRHHCRICGSILCNSCSKFLEYKSACKLVKPAKLYTDPYDRIDDQLQYKDADKMPQIRCCEDCKRLLDRRIQTIEDHYNQPTFLEFYEKLRKTMNEADDLIISQSSMSPGGEKQTTLELKSRIQDLRHVVASMSSKLTKMAEREQSGRQAYLMKAIGQSVGYWFKESLEGKLNRLHFNSMGLGQSADGLKSTGWVSEQVKTPPVGVGEDEDPLLIQIRNLEGYIRQAKLANRYEEVAALEANKRDLEIEYFIQRDLSKSTSEMALLGEDHTGGGAADDDDDDDVFDNPITSVETKPDDNNVVEGNEEE